MKIAVDLLYLYKNTNSGTGKHIEELLRGLADAGLLAEITIFVQDTLYENYIKSIPESDSLCGISHVVCRQGSLFDFINRRMKKGGKFSKEFYLNRFVLPKLLKAGGYDLLFCPYNKVFNSDCGGIPSVVVVHDLFHRNYQSGGSIRRRLWRSCVAHETERNIRKAAMVVAVSEYVRQDIIKHIPSVSPDRIMTIHNSITVSEETASIPGIEKSFILCVSEHANHKNHITLLKAFDILRDRIRHKLVLLGGNREATQSLRDFIEEKQLKDRVVFLSNISDAQRNWLYKNTDLLVSPSLHEGFGRTPVEAAMLGAMVLTSRSTSLPEVTMEKLNYYEPATDENVLAARIAELLQQPVPEEQRKETAAFFASAYGAETAARRFYSAFERVVGK